MTDVGDYMIGMVKTNKKELCKDTINNMTRVCLGGSDLVLNKNSRVPGNRPIIAIGYNYNYRKVVSFIAIEGTGSTQSSILSLSK